MPINYQAALTAALARRAIALVLTQPAPHQQLRLTLPRPGFHESLPGLTRESGTLLALDETHPQVVGPGGLSWMWRLDPDLIASGRSIAGAVPSVPGA